MAAIAPEDWARIWAHAWLDTRFRELLRHNPAEAVAVFQKVFPVPPFQPHDRLFDVEEIYLKDFLKKRPDQLEEMAKDGTIDGVAQVVQPNEFQLVPETQA